MCADATPRARIHAMVRGQQGGGGFAIPLAHQTAARIQERDWQDFTCDPTQLANGLRDLVDAVAPDGLAVTTPGILLEDGADPLGSVQFETALEATRRLSASLGERVALAAVLPAPGALSGGVDSVVELGKQALGAGADIVVIDGAGEGAGLTTLANIARFHQAVAFGTDASLGLPLVERIPLDEPTAARGVALTMETVPRETDISVLEDWVDEVRGTG